MEEDEWKRQLRQEWKEMEKKATKVLKDFASNLNCCWIKQPFRIFYHNYKSILPTLKQQNDVF